MVNGLRLNAVTGPDEMAVAGLAMGSDGAIGSTYNVQPKLNVAMHNAFRAGDHKLAMQLQTKLNHVIAALIKHSNCAARGTNIISGLKCWYRHLGFDVGQARDAAATALSAETEKELVTALTTCGWTVE
jgi:dihydrodipicolinate synthase/N-acetylneuraminate lyase